MIENKETRNTLAMDETDGRSAKKSYQNPQMRIYGNIREVTQGTGRNGNQDNPNPAGGQTKSLL